MPEASEPPACAMLGLPPPRPPTKPAMHIAVSYGLNISTAARSISHRVKDEVEQATGLKVARVIVSVDDVIA